MSRRRRTRRLTTAATAHAPHPAEVTAARSVVLARTLATLRALRGEDVEIPPRDPHAEATVLADARARGTDIERTRADLVDRLAAVAGAE